jgi:CHAT domain-containing protein
VLVETTTLTKPDEVGVIQTMAQPSWTDEQFVEMIMSLCESDELNEFLRCNRQKVNKQVFRILRDKVSNLVHADLHLAMQVAELGRKASELIRDPMSKVLADHAYGMVLHISGQYADAASVYHHVESEFEQLDEEVEAARVAKTRVNVLMYLGQYEEAFKIGIHARETLNRLNESILLAQLDVTIGNIHHRLDQYWEALECYDRAREVFVSHQDKMGLALVNYNAANQYTCLNEFERALALYQEAGQTFERLNMPRLVNDAEYSIAWLHFQRGHFQESLKLFYKVNDRAKELGDVITDALCDLDLAEVYLRLNAHEDALESAQSAVQKFNNLGMTYEHIKARMYVGIARTNRGEYGDAEQELQAARQGFTEEGNDVFTALTDVYLSDLYTRQQDWPQALIYGQEANQILTRLAVASKTPYAQMQLAQIYYLMGQLDEARQLCQSVLATMQEMESPWLRHQCLHILGVTMEQGGQLDEAYQCYRQAVEHLESLRSTIRVDEFKSTFLEDKPSVYENLVDVCLRAGTSEKIEEALAYAEAAKSRTLVDWLASSGHFQCQGITTSNGALNQEWQQLREHLNWYYSRINHYEQRPPDRRPAHVIEPLRELARQCEQQLASLARRVQIEGADSPLLQSAVRPDIGLLRQTLGENDILIEYTIARQRVHVFVVSREVVRVVCDLTTADSLRMRLQQLRSCFNPATARQSLIEGRGGSAYVRTERCLRELYAELIKPIEPLIEDRKLLIVPHGPLHYVPFHALHDGRGHMIDRQDISYSPSASAYKFCVERGRVRRADGPALVMGVPDQAAPYIQDEIAAMKSLWPEAQVYLGPEATLDRLKQLAPTCRMLHLASHAAFRRDNPLFSAFQLGDGWLTFYDVLELNLNAELVTLSACETGLNEVLAGDELVGLMRGFLYGGASSLLVSLWMISDRCTAELMGQFYRGLAEGASKRAALCQAQRRLKQVYEHPYYWAPFVLLGAA